MTTFAPSSSDVAVSQSSGSFFGHPRGLATLFFTEFWERFSYYGMRAILLLFMTAPAAASGMEFDTATAGFIYGLYTSLAYLGNLPGGWIADKLIGQRRAVLYGGVLISLGNLLLAFHGVAFLFSGLLFIILGTSLLKPNVSAMVGSLYRPDEPARRDAGFSIFYMGINAGAFCAPLIVGYFGETINWHLGFLASSIGMAIGIIWYTLGTKHIAHIGLVSEANQPHIRSNTRSFGIVAAVVLLVVGLIGLAHATNLITVTVGGIKTVFNVAYVVIPLAFFINILSGNKLANDEKKRFTVIGIFFILSAIFWGSFEQAGSTLTIFARDYTNRLLGAMEIPVSYFQSLNALFIISLAPVFAVLWVKLGKRNPSSPTKLALGLVLVGVGFLLLSVVASDASSASKVSPLWLVSVYLIHTLGELCLSPVGLSNVTKLAPERYVSQAMGIWFLGSSVGNYAAGQAAAMIEQFPMAQVFFIVFCIASGAGLIALLCVKPIKSLMGNVQ
jgi:POT family proton-dependent oligopeptide transporter